MSTPTAGSTPIRPVPAEAARRVWEVTCNVLLSLLFLKFAINQGAIAWETLRISSILLVFKVSTDVLFYLTRSMPKGTSMSLYDWWVAIAGTGSILLFRAEDGGADRVAGQAIQLCGIALQVLSMLSLNRSIGMVAANRGVKTGGLYRFVRHPLYLSYCVAFLGFVMNHPTQHNLIVYIAAIGLWVLRLIAEERFLMKDPAYQEFAKRTQYRLIPYVY